MKTIVLGDTHGRPLWKTAIKNENPDRVIFIGDYFDSFDIQGIDQLRNFEEILEFKKASLAYMKEAKKNNSPIILLIGNHDHHYFPEIGNTGTSGFQQRMAISFAHLLNENRDFFQIAYQSDEFLFSHAGISPEFMDMTFGKEGWEIESVAEQVNELFHHRPQVFQFFGTNPSGDNTYQTPIWIRPNALMTANKKHPKSLKKKYIQVVGHTQVKKIDLAFSKKAAGGRYYFIDCLGTSGEYLIIENGEIKVGSVIAHGAV
jgi:predicted phosphodiesterase